MNWTVQNISQKSIVFEKPSIIKQSMLSGKQFVNGLKGQRMVYLKHNLVENRGCFHKAVNLSNDNHWMCYKIICKMHYVIITV